MTEAKRQSAYMKGAQPSSEPMCANCMYYMPHYILNPLGRYIEACCGHCMAGYSKHRQPWDTCKRFAGKENRQ